MSRKYEQLELRLTPRKGGTRVEYIHHGLRKKTYLSREDVPGNSKEDVKKVAENHRVKITPRLRLPKRVNG